MQEKPETWVRSLVRKISQSRKWQPTPVSLPGKSHGQRSLAGYSPRGRRVWAHTHTHTNTHTLPPLFLCFVMRLSMVPISLFFHFPVHITFSPSSARNSAGWGSLPTRGIQTFTPKRAWAFNPGFPGFCSFPVTFTIRHASTKQQSQITLWVSDTILLACVV